MPSLPIKYAILSVLVLSAQLINAQKKAIDSLTNQKITFENRSDFKETDTNYLKLLYRVSISYIYENQDSVKNIANKSLEISRRINYIKGISGSLVALGSADVFKGNFKSGFKKLNEGKTMAESISADSIYLQAVNVLGLGNYIKKDFPETYRIYQDGIKKARQKKNRHWEFTFTMNLATTFSIIKDYDRALSYYNRCLELLEQSDDVLRRAEIESNLGYLYGKTEQFEKAKSYSNRSIATFKELKFGAWESFALTTLGGTAVEEEMFDKAIDYYRQALEVLKELNDKKREADVHLGLSEAYILKSDISNAKEYALKAEKTARSMNYAEGILQSARLLYKIHKNQNEPLKAIEYLETEQRLSDSIQIAENAARLLMLEAENQWQNEQKIIENKNRKKVNQRNLIIYVSSFLFLVLSVIIFLIRKNHLNQKKTNKRLKEINEAKDKVFSVIGHDLRTPISTLQELLELYKDKEISEKEIAKITPKLKENVDYNSFMLNNLLVWAQSQMNGMVATPEKLNLSSELRLTIDFFREEMSKKEISFEQDITDKSEILFDGHQFKIILRNLLSNAIKFTPNGGRITVKSVMLKDSCEIEITDTGVGFDRKALKSFHQNSSIQSNLGTENEKGIGLGLAISKTLASLNNSKLDIHSEIGKGTQIKLTIPKQQ